MLKISELIERLDVMLVVYGDIPIRLYDSEGNLSFINNYDDNFIISENVDNHHIIICNGGYQTKREKTNTLDIYE